MTTAENKANIGFIRLELAKAIKRAMKVVAASKETDLCMAISYNSKQLIEPSRYLEMKDGDPEQLLNMIQAHVLKSNNRVSQPLQGRDELEHLIEVALRRVNGEKETDLCKYIPNGEKRLHHFAYLKIKSTDPKRLMHLIRVHIMEKKPAWYPYKFKRSPSKKKSQPDGCNQGLSRGDKNDREGNQNNHTSYPSTWNSLGSETGETYPSTAELVPSQSTSCWQMEPFCYTKNFSSTQRASTKDRLAVENSISMI